MEGINVEVRSAGKEGIESEWWWTGGECKGRAARRGGGGREVRVRVAEERVGMVRQGARLRRRRCSLAMRAQWSGVALALSHTSERDLGAASIAGGRNGRPPSLNWMAAMWSGREGKQALMVAHRASMDHHRRA
jgi:hypothetical protein